MKKLMTLLSYATVQKHDFEGFQLVHDDSDMGVEPVKEDQSNHGDQ